MKCLGGYKSIHTNPAYSVNKSICGGCWREIPDVVIELLELEADERLIHDNQVCYTKHSVRETIADLETYIEASVENGKKQDGGI